MAQAWIMGETLPCRLLAPGSSERYKELCWVENPLGLGVTILQSPAPLPQ